MIFEGISMDGTVQGERVLKRNSRKDESTKDTEKY